MNNFKKNLHIKKYLATNWNNKKNIKNQKHIKLLKLENWSYKKTILIY